MPALKTGLARGPRCEQIAVHPAIFFGKNRRKSGGASPRENMRARAAEPFRTVLRAAEPFRTVLGANRTVTRTVTRPGVNF